MKKHFLSTLLINATLLFSAHSYADFQKSTLTVSNKVVVGTRLTLTDSADIRKAVRAGELTNQSADLIRDYVEKHDSFNAKTPRQSLGSFSKPILQTTFGIVAGVLAYSYTTSGESVTKMVDYGRSGIAKEMSKNQGPYISSIITDQIVDHAFIVSTYNWAITSAFWAAGISSGVGMLADKAIESQKSKLNVDIRLDNQNKQLIYIDGELLSEK